MGNRLFEIVKRETCTHCGQERRTYRRWLHPEMVSFMKRLDGLGRGVHHTREIFFDAAKASTDAAYLTHWGLVTRYGKGEYELTDRGRYFVSGELRAPAWIDLRSGKLVGKSTNRIKVSQV